MSSSDTTDAKVVGANNNRPNINRIRLEAIERRRHKASEIIKLRKRKLSELYYVNKSPFIPISDQKILETESILLTFLERNNFENGHKFDLNTLPQQPVSRTPSTSTPLRNNSIPRQTPANRSNQQQQASRRLGASASPPLKKVSPPSQPVQLQTPKLLQHSPTHQFPLQPPSSSASSSKLASQSSQSPPQKPAEPVEGPPLKVQKILPSLETQDSPDQSLKEELKVSEQQELPKSSENLSLSPVINNTNNTPISNNSIILETNKESHPEVQEVYEIPPIAKDYIAPPTLSSLIKAYADSKPAELTEEEKLRKKRELDVSDIDINKLSVLLMPGNLPSQIPESSPLAELYYLTQTCPLSKLIPTTHKALTTETYESALLEGKLAVVYSRIEELKRQKKWSLRQPQKYHDPFLLHPSHKSHWSNLIEEGKWMATDFKEGRKFKLVQCLFVAQAVSDYWTYGKVMCVKRRPIQHLGEELKDNEVSNDNDNDNEKVEVSEENMDVDVKEENEEDKEGKSEGEEEKSEEEQEKESDKEEPEQAEQDIEDEKETIDVSLLLKRPDPASEIPVPTLPQFTKDQIPKESQPFKMYIDKSELSVLNSNLVDSLPVYDAFSSVKDNKQPPIVPVSKLLTPLDEETEDWYKVLLKENYFFRGSSYATEKGLFGFSSTKRLTFIRPPIPPPLKYLDLRIPTIWLPEDDRHLIRYVAEFQFNWSIVSAHLSARPTNGYFSNIERRTPWQCFERYIQLNDKFQFSDMRGGYTPQAQMWLEAAHKAQTTTKRRISPLGVGNESIQRGHKRLRWASMFEAMRKLMKKRENVPKTNPPASRKDDKKIAAPTPLDLAKLKYERDKAIQEAYLHQNTNLNMKRSGSQQLLQLSGQLTPQARSNSSNSQIQLVQRQLAAAAAVANSNKPGNAANINTNNNNPATQLFLVQQQLLQVQLLLQRLQKQRSAGAGAVNAATSASDGSPVSGNPVPLNRSGSSGVQKAQLQASSAALLAQQQRLLLQQQQQLQRGGPRSNSNPLPTLTAPNGQPYSNEQLQQLMQLQRQRNLQQQQQQQKLLQLQSAPASTANSNSGTPIISGGANLVSNNNNGADGSNRMSPAMASAATVKTGPNGTPVKNFPTSFSNAQVTAIVQQIQTQHPHLNKQQVSRLAASYLHNLSTQQQQLQHRAMSNQTNKALKQTSSNPSTPMLQQSTQLNNGAATAPQQGRNLASSLQMLNSAQLTKLANSPTLTLNQRQQILSVQQQRLRNAGQTVLANNRAAVAGAGNTGKAVNVVPNNNTSRPMSNVSSRTSSGPIPTPQQLAAHRAKLQEQQQQQQQQQQGGDSGSPPGA